MRIVLCAALLVLACAAPLTQPSQAAAVSTAMRTTTILATGTSGTRIRVPHATRIDMDKVRLVPGPGTHRAFVLLRPDTQACGNPRITLCMFTLLGWVRGVHPNVGTSHQGDAAHNFVALANNPAQQAAGWATVYVVSDGPVRVQFHFTDLAGSTTLTARGRVRGATGVLPDACATACDLDPTATTGLGYGGVRVPLRSPSFTYALAYVERSLRDTAATGHSMTGQAISCLQPNYFDPRASTDPSAYKAGCNEPPKDREEVVQLPSDLASCSDPAMTGMFCQTYEPASQRAVYFGHRVAYANEFAALPGETAPVMGGVYLWLEYRLT